MRNEKIRFNRKQIINMCEKTEEGLPPEWRQVFIKSTAKVQHDTLNFFLLTSTYPKSIQDITTKYWYTTLLRQITKRPTSESHRQKIFPNKNIPSIWHNINPVLSNPKCVNTEEFSPASSCTKSIRMYMGETVLYARRRKKTLSTSFSSVLSVSASQSR